MAFSLGVIVGHNDLPTLAVKQGGSIWALSQWAAQDAGLAPKVKDALSATNLDRLLASGKSTWRAVDKVIESAIGSDSLPRIIGDPTTVMPFTIADFVDFFASRIHAENASRIMRPTNPGLPPAWTHLPIAYHSRAGSVVPSGTPIRRPKGLVRDGEDYNYQPTAKLDFEAEIGYVVGRSSSQGTPVSGKEMADYVFGLCIVNDWSARDIQSTESFPLGPFLGKSFATTISPWITPLSQLEGARVAVPSSQDETLPQYLREVDDWGLDLSVSIRINGQEISRPRYESTHWSGAQMLAHMTVNGAPLRTGDLYASGTVSSDAVDEYGCLLELTWDGQKPIAAAGEVRGYLRDTDEVIISAAANFADGSTFDLGQAMGSVLPPLG